MSRNSRILAVALSAFLGATPARGESDRGTITGRVVEEGSGRPLHFANVVIIGTLLGASVDREDGVFFVRVPPGVYGIRGTRAEYESITLQGVHVEPGDTTHVEIVLRSVAFALNPRDPMGEISNGVLTNSNDRRRVALMSSYQWGPCGPSPGYEYGVASAHGPQEAHQRIRRALGLIPPVDIESWEPDLECGSVTATLRDSCGTVLRISWDGADRLPPAPPTRTDVSASEANNTRLLHVGAPHDSDRAWPIPVLSTLETALMDVFRLWLEGERSITTADSPSLDAVAELLGFLEGQRVTAFGHCDLDFR